METIYVGALQVRQMPKHLHQPSARERKIMKVWLIIVLEVNYMFPNQLLAEGF